MTEKQNVKFVKLLLSNKMLEREHFAATQTVSASVLFQDLR